MPLFVIIAGRVIDLLMLLILITSLLSWVQPDPRNPIVKVLHTIVDPMLHPIRAILPAMGGMDFSPLVAILVLRMLQGLFSGSLSQ